MDSLSSSLSNSLNSGGLFLAFLFSYFGGVVSSLTPCVYPMIPITISVVGGTSITDLKAKSAWRNIFSRIAAYVGGMTIIYSFLGVLAGLTGRVFGSFTNSSGWYLGLGLIMTVAALGMIDVFSFDPAFWFRGILGNRRPANFEHKSQSPGFWSAIFLGASSGTIAAPCTTPVLAVILAFIAKTQSVVYGLFLMLGFSLGLSTILLIIAVFAGAVKHLPRSGKWMKAIKMLSGLILLIFAEYLIYRAGTMGGR